MSMIEKLPRDHYKNIEKLKSLIDDSRIKLISPTRNRIPALRKDRRTAGTQDRHMAMLQQAELAPDRLRAGTKRRAPEQQIHEPSRENQIGEPETKNRRNQIGALRLAEKIILHKKRTAAEKTAPGLRPGHETEQKK
jgi:hypothetical protein